MQVNYNKYKFPIPQCKPNQINVSSIQIIETVARTLYVNIKQHNARTKAMSYKKNALAEAISYTPIQKQYIEND